jgi:hypothetical protein
MSRLAIGLVLLAIGCAEQFDHHFETGAAAHSSDLARRGWVPEWLPAEASNVHIQHDLDTNEEWLRFELGEKQRSALVVGLQWLSSADIETVAIRSPRGAPWWFEGLIQQEPANDSALNANIFRGVDRLVLLEKTGSRVFAYVQGQ